MPGGAAHTAGIAFRQCIATVIEVGRLASVSVESST